MLWPASGRVPQADAAGRARPARDPFLIGRDDHMEGVRMPGEIHACGHRSSQRQERHVILAAVRKGDALAVGTDVGEQALRIRGNRQRLARSGFQTCAAP